MKKIFRLYKLVMFLWSLAPIIITLNRVLRSGKQKKRPAEKEKQEA